MVEKSCGAVVFTRLRDRIKYVIIRSKEGIYGFPKGHVELRETETETALREGFEETGLRVSFMEGFKTAITKDIAAYKALGTQQLASFACYLGPDYEELYEPVDITAFTEENR